MVLGGATHLRISSPGPETRTAVSRKLFELALAGHIGIRTGRIAREAAQISLIAALTPKAVSASEHRQLSLAR